MTDSVEQWLDEVGLTELAERFARNHVGLDLLTRLTEDDLRELGLTIGQRRRFLDAVEALGTPDRRDNTTDGSLPSLDVAERRQLTVMFCDLVGSTALSRRLDPEDLRELMRAYQHACKGAIERYGGFIARYMGDGILAYFGYPGAHEDDAERAIHAGLAVVNAVRELDTVPGLAAHPRLATRVGIATGPVVVGDVVGEGVSRESTVVGDTPNLAARLQTAAGADEVVVAAGTHAVARGRFAYEDLAPIELKGFAEPVRAWRVVASSNARSRFEALHGERVTPMVGREHEIDLLLERWAHARDGEGQVVFLSGEAGIGKSRISDAVRESVGGDGAIRLRYQCSPHHGDDALHPVIEQIIHAARMHTEDSPPIQLKKLESLLVPGVDTVEQQVPVIASLLSIPIEGRDPLLGMTPEQLKEATLATLAAQMEALTMRRPVLLIYEDVHWADATSLELLALLVERVQSTRALMVVTSRPEFHPPWTSESHVTSLALNRFSHRQALELIQRVTDGRSLPDEVRSQILEKTDGIPLFVEELTKTVLESGLLEDRGDHYALNAPLPSFAIPSTLHDSLMARLDRLAGVREIAQVASVIGREFSAELLAAVSPLSPGELERGLASLVDAGLLFRRGLPPRVRYVFKHALVQDTAYESLLKSSRRKLHGRIADALLELSPSAELVEPGLLAQHYTEAHRTETALGYWLAAGKRAAEQAAYVEAVAHLTRGLSLLEDMPEGADRARQEIAFRVSLGVPLMKRKTVASSEVGENYRQARKLCEEFGDAQQLFPVLWGQWYHHMCRFEVREACGLADELLETGKVLSGDPLELEAHHCQWASRFLVGDLSKSLEHADHGIRLYTPQTHHPLMFFYGGHDAGVCAYDVGALALWLSGETERAQRRMNEAQRLACELGQSSTLANTVSKALTLAGFRCDLDSISTLGARLLDYTRGEWAEQSRPHATAALAWVDFKRGKRDGALAQMREALRSGLLEDPWNIYLVPMVATSLATSGAVDEARTIISESLVLARRNDVHWWSSELMRTNGEFLSRDPSVDPAESQSWLEQALDTARAQKARSLELRAALSLAGHLERQGTELGADDPLARVARSFAKDFGSAALMKAREAYRLLC